MHFGVLVSSLIALISIHQSFHFKTAHLIFKYLICFCIWRIYFIFTVQYFSNGKNQICFLTLLQIQVLNKGLADNPGEDNPTLPQGFFCVGTRRYGVPRNENDESKFVCKYCTSRPSMIN